MALTNKMKTARLAKLLGGGSLPVLHGVETASSSWLVGALLVDDGSGAITEATSPLAASGKGKSLCFGMATDAATGVTAADVLFDRLYGDTVVEMNLSDSTLGTHTLAQTDQWVCYTVAKDAATGNWYLDATNATPSTVGGGVVVGFKDAIGTVDPRVYAILSSDVIGTTAGVLF